MPLPTINENVQFNEPNSPEYHANLEEIVVMTETKKRSKSFKWNVNSVFCAFLTLVLFVVFSFGINQIYYALTGVYIIIIGLFILGIQQMVALNNLRRESILIRFNNEQIV